MSLKAIAKKTEELVHTFNKHISRVSLAGLLVLTVFSAVDVGGRYFFNSPVPGSTDIITVLLIIIVFPGFGHVTYKRGHIRTDILYARFSVRTRGLLDVISLSLCTTFSFYLTKQLILRAWDAIKNPPGICTGYFQFPHLPFIILGAICCLFMCLELFIWLLHSFRDAVDGKERASKAVQ